MEQPENLNKENFWNELKENYPDAFEHFLAWIDEYKKLVEWDKLFAEGVKFHDVPLEIQAGILARYGTEMQLYEDCHPAFRKGYGEVMKEYPNQTRRLFTEAQRSIERKKNAN